MYVIVCFLDWTHLVTKLCLYVQPPPVITIVSSSGIPQDISPLWRNAKVPPPATKRRWKLDHFSKPGTISAVNSASASSWLPSNTMESGSDGGLQATWKFLTELKSELFISVEDIKGWPHVVQVGPAGVGAGPNQASFWNRSSSTGDQLSPRQVGEAHPRNCFGQIRDRAGVVYRRREDFDRGEEGFATSRTADYQLSWYKTDQRSSYKKRKNFKI